MATKTWNGTGANWNSAASWTPSGVPGSADDVFLSPAAAAILTLNASPTVRSITIGAKATLFANAARTLTATNGIIVNGVLQAGLGVLTVASAVSGAGSLIAGAPGAAGTIRLNAAATIASASFAGTTGASGSLIEIGTAGALTLTNALAIGAYNLKLDGAASVVTAASGLTISTGIVSGQGKIAAAISGTGGSSTLATILATGGALEITGKIVNGTGAIGLSVASGSTSRLLLDAAGNSVSTAGFASATGGGTLELAAGATLTATNAIALGSNRIKLDGASSLLTASAGITATTGTISGQGKIAAAIQATGAAKITESGGTLELAGAVTNGSGGAIVLTIGAAAADKLLLSAGASSVSTATFSSATGAGTLEIGASAALTVANALAVGANKILLDNASGAQLGVTSTTGITLAGGSITGTGTIATATKITGYGAVGIALANGTGAGTITASGGVLDLIGKVNQASGTNRTLAIATSAGSTLKIDGIANSGAISISNANQTLQIGATGALTLSAAQTVTNGKIVLSGGVLTDASGLALGSGSSNGALSGFGKVAANVSRGGTGTGSSITASGGKLEITGSVGTAAAPLGSLVVGAGAADRLLLDGASFARAASFSGSTGTLEIGASGALTITTATALAVGANTLLLDGSGTQLTDTSGVTLAGGAINGTGLVSATSAISGYGTVAINVVGGTITASGGAMTLSGLINQSGSAASLVINNGSTLNLTNSGPLGTAAAPTVTLNGTGDTLNATGMALSDLHLGVISGFVQSDVIQVQAFTANDTITYNAAAHTITITGGGHSQTLTFSASTDVSQIKLKDPALINTLTICFLGGTMIATPDGEAAVETLRAGDLVLTTEGAARPVIWLGKQTVSTTFVDKLHVLPIRVKAGALADNVPHRDLLLSPDHALLVDGLLVQAGALVNGTSILRETNVPKALVYYHVELEDHSLILAENAPAETFIDNVARMNFDNWRDYAALYPIDKAIAEMPFPRAKAFRQVPRALRNALAERGEGLGAKERAVA
jgi:large repetitive protein